MFARFALFAFRVAPLGLAQFPKAYLADAVAGPALLPSGEGADARKLLILAPAGMAVDAQNNTNQYASTIYRHSSARTDSTSAR